ncbi:MAG: rhamnulokinase, partial [Bacteroidales bacterium]|nr:rhamnulokinase [Bacteroidales bacterium]
IDTWGVDYGLLAADGNLLGIPYAYRDSRTDGMMEEFFRLIPRETVYEYTGIQFMQLNTLFQIFAAKKSNNSLLNHATDLLFIPDLLNYLFTGIKKTEFSFASTSQLLNPVTGNWENKLFEAMQVPVSIMQEIILPGTILGTISPGVSGETGAGKVSVAAVASHDTGSAVAAVPALGKNWAYLSSGTWSLMGIEVDKPIINSKSLEYNFTNEGGVDGTIRFLKNITGMWLLQQSKKSWSETKDFSYDELIAMAKNENNFQCFVDTDAHELMNPSDMPAAIQKYCSRTGQHIPDTIGKIVRCIFDSLAMKYKFVLNQLQELSPFPVEVLHIIGGGSKQYLNQIIANALGIPVVAGPAEATAIGNIMMQARATGQVKDITEMRSIIAGSFTSETFYPQDTRLWDDAFDKYLRVTSDNN